MKILVCGQEAPLPPPNGLRLQVSALVGELRKNHDVRVLAFRMPDQKDDEVEYLRLVPFPLSTSRAKAWALAASIMRRRPHGVDAMARSMRAPLREELELFRPDVVHVTMGRLAALGQELVGWPSVLAALDAWYLTRQAEVRIASGLNRALLSREVARVRQFEATEYPGFDSVVVVSREDQQELASLVPGMRIAAIPNGVDTDQFIPGSWEARERSMLLFHGLMRFAPNVTAAEFLARRVLPLVRAVRPDAGLTIVGRAPSESVRALARLDGVDVTGDVPDINPWLARGRVYICPMLSGTGIKNKLLEAMASGLPCVVTPLALQGIEARAGQEILIGSSEEEIAAHVVRLLADDDEARRLGEAARHWVERNHSWTAAAQAYVRVYDRAIERSRRSRVSQDGRRRAPAGAPVQPETLSGDVIQSENDVAKWKSQWDTLATQCERPFCSPSWMLSWWRHMAPIGSQLRISVATEGDSLIGIAPFFADRGYGGLTRYRLLGAGTAMPVQPLAKLGREREAARVLASCIAGSQPSAKVIMLEGIPSGSPWPRLLTEMWPSNREPWLHTDFARTTPTLDLSKLTYEEWLRSRSRNFRQQMARSRRKLLEQGAVFRLTDTEELEGAVDSFVRLHHARWAWRGGSNVLGPGVERMLLESGRELGKGRFRLWSIDVDGEPVSSQIFLAAGAQLCYWLGGFDESWSRYHPAMLAIMAAIEHGHEMGEYRIDFGPGAQLYKYRFANGEDVLDWITLLPRRRGYRRARLHLVPKHAYRAIGAMLPSTVKERLRSIVGRTPTWAR